MKFRYTIEETSKNGTKDTISRDIEKDELILGRGSACDILFDSQLVSLTHAKLGLVNSELCVEDLGSLSGVKVNGKVIQRQAVQAGDEIKLGDVTLTVTYEGAIWGVVERREEAKKEDTEAIVARQLVGLDLKNKLPSVRVLSLLLALIVLGCYFGFPMTTSKKESWSSGPISNNHLMIADKCEACHSEPFVRVKDDQCLACHRMSDHAAPFGVDAQKEHSNKALEVRCAVCHMEHNGDQGLIASAPELCTNCHANIKAVYADAVRANVPSMNRHPQFSVRVQPARPGDSYKRVSLNDAAQLKDNSNVKLNHEVHLITLRGPKGPTKLNCRDCHNPAPGLRTIEPINFEKHCESCHGLEFDARLPGKQVPHGDPDVVYKFLYAEYAKLLLSSENDTSVQETFNIRARPGSESAASGAQSRDQFVRAFVEKESRAAEDQLFSRTACYLCHRVARKELTDDELRTNALSRYEVMTPQIPDRWMADSIFSHGAHEEVQCEDCHQDVRKSRKTNDILLPRVAKCQECHTEHGGGGKVKSDCIMCHSFHSPLLVHEDQKRSTENILKSVRP